MFPADPHPTPAGFRGGQRGDFEDRRDGPWDGGRGGGGGGGGPPHMEFREADPSESSDVRRPLGQHEWLRMK